MIQDVFRYKSLSTDQLLYDLNWVLNARSLIRDHLPDFQGEILVSISDLVGEEIVEKWYAEQVNDPSKISSFFSIDEQLIVGKYFEKLIAYVFYQLPRFEVVHYSKQFFSKKQTIGEIDFIIHDLHNHTNIHVEVAVKYYMGFKNIGKHDLWIGPNGRDTLKKKVVKLKRQLMLSDQLDIEVVEKRVLLLGYFFKYWKHSKWPYFNNTTEDQGIWLYEDEIEDYFDPGSVYLIVPKYKWLGFYIDKNSSFLNGIELKKEIKKQIQEIGKGIMVIQLDELAQTLIRRFIVVPMKWPKL